MEVLKRTVPKGNEKVMEWMILILEKGVEEEQDIALGQVRDLHQNCGTSRTINLIIDRLFSRKDPARWHDISESGEKVLIKALAEAAKLNSLHSTAKA